MPRIDWESFAQRFAVTSERGGIAVTTSGARLARRCLEEVIEPSECARAVDWYVAGEPGGDLARSVLRLLRPESAMARCAAVARDKSIPVRQRRSAVELFRFITDASGLGRVEEFLQDEDGEVQVWGSAIVSQLALDGEVTEGECVFLLERMASHSNPEVRRVSGVVQEWFSKAKLREEP